MKSRELNALLEECGALKKGHFVLSSGLHSGRYVQCARLLELPSRAAAVGEALADRLEAYRPEVIVSPALGGLIIGHQVAAALELPFRFAERKQRELKLRRGFQLTAGERVAVVEDVVTTGKSSREVFELVRVAGAQAVSLGAIIDRSDGRASFEVPFESLLSLPLEAFEAAQCRLCAAGEVLDAPGSRVP